MATFMDYYRDELAKRGGSTRTPSVIVPKAALPAAAQEEEQNPVGSAVNWVMDMLSRTTYGMTNANRENVNRLVGGAKRTQQGDVLGGIGEILSGIPTMPSFLSGPGAQVTELMKRAAGNSTDQRFLEGLTSNDPALKKSNADLIEYSTDKVGSTFDPNYEDVADNVTPAVKGLGGFAMDVAGDPLTFVSGTGLIKGAGGLARIADRGLSKVSEGLVGAKYVKEAAEEAVKAPKGKKTKGLREENPFEDATNLDPGAFRPAQQADSGKVERLETFSTDLARVQEMFGGSVPRPARPAGVPERLALESGAEAAPAAVRAPLGLEAPAIAKENPPAEPRGGVQPTLPDEVLDESGAIPAPGGTFADLIMKSPNRQGISDTLTALADDVAAPRTVQTYNEWANSLPPNHLIKVPGAAQSIPVAKLREDLARFKDPSIKPALKPTREYLDRTLNVLRQEYQQTVAPRGTVVDAMSAFRARQERALRDGLGDDLFEYLRKINTPARFQKALVSIRNVIEPDEAVMDTLRNMDQNLARVLTQRLGVPRAATVKTPEEAAALAERLLSDSEPYQAALGKGLAKALDAELVDLQEKGYLFYLQKLGMKVARTSQKKGEGLGRYVDQLNGFSQYTMLRNQADAIEIAALDIMRSQGIKGTSFKDLYSAQRTAVYKAAALRVMEDQARLLDDIGAHMSIGVGPNTTQLSMSEVYRGIIAAAEELGIPRTIDQGLFNYGTQAAPTAVTDAVAAAVAGGSREDILAILMDPKKYGNKGLLPNSTGKRPNNLIDSGHGWGFNSRKAAYDVAQELTGNARDARALVRTLEAGRKSGTTGATRKANHYYLQYKANGRNYMAEALSDAIMQAAPGLRARAAQNEVSFIARTKQEIHKLSSDELAKIEAFLKDPSGTIAKIRAFKAREKRIEAEAAKINASVDAVDAAEEVVDAALGNELVSVMAAAGKADPQYVSAEKALDLYRANETFTGGTWDDLVDDFDARPSDRLGPNEEWAEVVDETAPLHGDWRDMLFDEAEEYITKTKKKSKQGRKGKFVDLSEDAPAMIDAFGNRIIDPYGIMKHKIRSWFNQNYMAANAMPVAHAWQNSMSMRTAYVGHQLNAIHKAARRISPDQDLLPSVFAAIQRGLTTTDPKMAELDDMIRGVLGDFFDLDGAGAKDGSLGNVFLRTTSDVNLVNAMLKAKGIDEVFDLDLAKQMMAENKMSLDEALAGQWRNWDVKDPLDFMHRMSLARQELAFNKGTAMSFMQMARDLGAVSKKAQPGFVRIQASGDSRFAAHLPRDVYVKRELAEELRQVEKVYRTSREFQGTLGDFVRNTLAPLTNAWKFAITLPRPGHHIRNLIGDTSVTWMRRGNRHFSQSWKDAVKLLTTRSNYTDVNMLEAANRYGIKDLPKGGDVIFATDRFEFTADELYAALAEGGALPTYHIGEDFLEGGGRLNSILGKLTLRDTAVGEQLGKLSEGRDHLARFQHFIQALRQDGKGWKGSRESLIDQAVKEVIKYHPDASLLTPTESKLRLAIPFYSWFGKIIPALVESAIMHPGRLSTFNKASYNWAVAAGLDPESLSDPFPDDQLFPSFLTESALGPQLMGSMFPFSAMGATGKEYIRVNPGIAHLDVMDTLGADPLRGIAGMTNPILRVPAELLSGGSWSTGAQINDWSDYLDQSLPGINYVANISGVSPTGSVESLLQGQGLDPQAQVEKGNKTDFDKALSVANWLTGLGVQNLSRPNYINYAEIEKRNQASEK